MNDKEFKLLQQKIETTHENITGIIVQKNNQRIYEQYFNGCDEASKIHVYSIAKSVLSLLLGIAHDDGSIDHLNRPIMDYFPEYQPKNPALKNITLKNLLTMTTPYKYKSGPLTYIRYFMSKDWVKFTLKKLGGHQPIG